MAVNKRSQSGVRREAAGGPVVQTNPISGFGLGKRRLDSAENTPRGVTTNRAAVPNEANRPRARSIVPVFHHSTIPVRCRMCETKPIGCLRPAMGAERQGEQAGASCTNKPNWPSGRGLRRRQSCETKPMPRLRIADWRLRIGDRPHRDTCPAAYRLPPAEGKMYETKPIGQGRPKGFTTETQRSQRQSRIPWHAGLRFPSPCPPCLRGEYSCQTKPIEQKCEG